MKPLHHYLLTLLCLTILASTLSHAEEQSVRPGVNRHYMDPEWQYWVNTFESPGREVFDRRLDIVEASAVHQGMDVADIGAGTGLFTRLFSRKVGPGSKVYAVDISRTFVENILRVSRERGQTNVQGIVNSARDVMLEAQSIDLAFSVDTYHHFEYPQSTLASIHWALRPGGRLIVIDFYKHPDKSPNWIMGHVRANKNTVIDEITSAGFVLLNDKPLLNTNYFLEFRKAQ